ncbi:MAG: hypothetical protein Q8T09_05915 [Candidatus Melainabacteria bacterium]|nr:hypothetical protein [Candidatus Melainabacteria bacterium]
METDRSNIALIPLSQDRAVAICRWLVLLPACYIVFSLSACFAGLPLAIYAFCFRLLIPQQLHVFLMLFVIALGACLGAIPTALLAYMLVPTQKFRFYMLVPLVLLAPSVFFATYNCYLSAASQISLSDYTLALVFLAAITPVIVFCLLKEVVKPAAIFAASLTIFKDVLTELDKQVLTLQLGLLIGSINYWSIMDYSAKPLTWLEIVSLVLAALATIALPLSLFRYRQQLSQQGLDNSKLLKIINVVIHAPLLFVLIGWLGRVQR